MEVFVNTLSEFEPAYIRELRAVTDYYGIHVASLHPFSCAFEPFMLFTHYERRFQDALHWHRGYFQAMNQLGAQIFVFHGDKWRGPSGENVCSDEEYFERFAQLRDLGREYGVTVAQENVERCRSRSMEFLLRMIRYLDGDVALVFDNKQAIRSQVGWKEYVEAVGEKVVHVHLSDSNEHEDCLPPGKGRADLSGILQALRGKGFDGSVMVEVYGEYMESGEPVYEGLRHLRELQL